MMNKSHLTEKPVLCKNLLFMTMFLTTAVVAQEDTQKPDDNALTSYQLPAVTVVATKYSTDVKRLAEDVSILNYQDIKQRQPTSLYSLLSDIPGIDVAGGPRDSSQRYKIRGLNDNLFVVDGGKVSNLASGGPYGDLYFDPALMGKIEILKGPASALWGSSAMGGVISMQTLEAEDLLRPGQKIGASIGLGVQSNDRQFKQTLSAYSKNESISVLARYIHRKSNNIKLGNSIKLPSSGIDRNSALVKFKWQPDEVSALTLSYMFYDSKTHVPLGPSGSVYDTDNELISAGLKRKNRMDNLNLQYHRDHTDNPWFNPNIVISYNKMKTTDRGSNEVMTPRGPKSVPMDMDTTVKTYDVDAHNSIYYQDDNIKNTLTFGYEFSRENLASLSNGERRTSKPDGKTDIHSLYLQNEFILFNRLTLIPGVRWDHFETTPKFVDKPSSSDSHMSWKFGLVYDIQPWISLFGNYAEAFRVPELSEMYRSGIHFSLPNQNCLKQFGPRPDCFVNNYFVANPDLKPQKASNKETGLRLNNSNLFTENDKAFFEVRYYRNDLKDYLETFVSMREMITTTRNIRNAKHEGYEVKANYDTPAWFAGLGYSHMKIKDKNTGKTATSSMPDMLTLQAGWRNPDYGVEIGWRMRYIDSYKPREDAPKVDTQYALDYPTGSYAVHGLWLSYQPKQLDDRLEIDINIDNILNKNYQAYQSISPGQGRNMMLNVSYNF